MSLNAKNTKNSNLPKIDPVEPGTYPGRLVGVVDLGLQAQRPYKGQEKKPVYTFATIYELVDEFLKNEDGEDDPEKPRWVSEIMPLYSLGSENAKSTKRYLALDPNQAMDGEWGKLVDTPCHVTLVQNKKPDGKVFVNIEAISLMRDKDAKRCPQLVNAPFVFDCDNPDPEAWERVPQWLKKMIVGNLEFKGSKLEKFVDHAPKGEQQDDGGPAEAEDSEEENPF